MHRSGRFWIKTAGLMGAALMMTACLAKAEPIQAGSRDAHTGPGVAASETAAPETAKASDASGFDAAESSQDAVLVVTDETEASENVTKDGSQSGEYAGSASQTETQGTGAAQGASETQGTGATQSTDEAQSTSGAQSAGESQKLLSKNGYEDQSRIGLDANWKYAGYSEIHSGAATMYLAPKNRKNRIIGVNAGHGTTGGTSVKTWCHPDYTAKVTGGTTAAGATKAVAVSTGMTFSDGTPESSVTLKEAQMLKELLLDAGYDVLMIRDTDDVQLDNIARTVICNNVADCHIAIHWDGDGLSYDKGCFYMSVPDALKSMTPVADTWKSSEYLGECLISGLKGQGCKIMSSGSMDMDLTQTSFSTVASVDIELGNQSSDHSDGALALLAQGLLEGINEYFAD